MEKYLNYSIEDFIADKGFRQWVLEKSADDERDWNIWMIQHPEKQEDIELARQLILNLHFTERLPESGKKEQVWMKISEQTNKIEKVSPRPFKIFRSIFIVKHWGKIAAAFLLVTATVLIFQLTVKESVTPYLVSTSYGETKKVILPDGSEVILNSNSSIKYINSGSTNESRQVWLSGEAFFTVKHTTDHQKFIVHIDNAQVEVLGTTFNINSRRGKSKVVLASGSVQITSDKGADKAIKMVPGEMVELEENKIVKKMVTPDIYSSWTNNNLVFDNLLVSEITQIIKDNYGLEIIFDNKDLLERRFKGSFRRDRPDVIIKALQVAYDLESTKNEKTIFLKSK